MSKKKEMVEQPVRIYTDGSFFPQDKVGGWACFVDDHVHFPVLIKGNDNFTSNNRAELTAALHAVSIAKNCFPDKNVEIVMDSQYAIHSVETRAARLFSEGALNDPARNIPNADLLEDIAVKLQQPGGRITIVHQKAHTGKVNTDALGNNVVDKAANSMGRRLCSH